MCVATERYKNNGCFCICKNSRIHHLSSREVTPPIVKISGKIAFAQKTISHGCVTYRVNKRVRLRVIKILCVRMRVSIRAKVRVSS